MTNSKYILEKLPKKFKVEKEINLLQKYFAINDLCMIDSIEETNDKNYYKLSFVTIQPFNLFISESIRNAIKDSRIVGMNQQLGYYETYAENSIGPNKKVRNYNDTIIITLRKK